MTTLQMVFLILGTVFTSASVFHTVMVWADMSIKCAAMASGKGYTKLSMDNTVAVVTGTLWTAAITSWAIFLKY